jgi:hypothetical protein
MSIRLDKVIYSSLHEAYKNYATVLGNIAIPADSIPDGFARDYPVDGSLSLTPLTIPYARAGTRADIYIVGNGVKVCANASTRLETGGPYIFKSTETFNVFIDYKPNQIEIFVEVFNGSGATITLIPQTLQFIVVEYDAPITSI